MRLRLQSLLLKFTRPWKEARSLVRELLHSTIMVESGFKSVLALIFSEVWRKG